MNPEFLARFPKQLGHWAIHGTFNALPSFLIALFLLNLWQSPSCVAAMLLAIAFYIFAFAVITSLPGPLADGNHVLSRAIRLGAKIRSWIAGLSLLLLPGGFATMFFIPDFWCGWAAVMVQNALAGWLGLHDSSLRALDESSQTTDRFLPVFTTTMIEGFFISFLLLMVSFFCVMFLQSRERRRMIKAIGMPADPSV